MCPNRPQSIILGVPGHIHARTREGEAGIKSDLAVDDFVKGCDSFFARTDVDALSGGREEGWNTSSESMPMSPPPPVMRIVVVGVGEGGSMSFVIQLDPCGVFGSGMVAVLTLGVCVCVSLSSVGRSRGRGRKQGERGKTIGCLNPSHPPMLWF